MQRRLHPINMESIKLKFLPPEEVKKIKQESRKATVIYPRSNAETEGEDQLQT